MIPRDLGNVCITGNRCRETRVFELVLRGRRKFPQWGMWNFGGGLFYLVVGIRQGTILTIQTFSKAKNKVL